MIPIVIDVIMADVEHEPPADLSPVKYTEEEEVEEEEEEALL